MQADWFVELGKDDPTLAVPWSSDDGSLQYVDLKRSPELIWEVREAIGEPGLTAFLQAVNSPPSAFETAKCDLWPSELMDVDDEEFGAAHKHEGYIDLFFSDESKRFEFAKHEALAKRACELLKKAPELPSRAEFVIRRCFFQPDETWREGFYWTLYVHGYGDDEESSKANWEIALNVIRNVLLQLS